MRKLKSNRFLLLGLFFISVFAYLFFIVGLTANQRHFNQIANDAERYYKEQLAALFVDYNNYPLKKDCYRADTGYGRPSKYITCEVTNNVQVAVSSDVQHMIEGFEAVIKQEGFKDNGQAAYSNSPIDVYFWMNYCQTHLVYSGSSSKLLLYHFVCDDQTLNYPMGYSH